jgi:hypothetical protein
MISFRELGPKRKQNSRESMGVLPQGKDLRAPGKKKEMMKFSRALKN